MAKQKPGDDANPEAGIKVPPPKKSYKVSLPHSPTRVVEAEDRHGAWEAYKKSVGLVSTEHDHEAVEVPAEAAPQE